MLMRERLLMPAGLLPLPAPLPSLTAAFSRRAAIFGAVAAPVALASLQAQEMAPMGVLKFEDTPSDADRHLAAMAAEICTVLDGATYALEPVHDEADQDRRLDRANALTLEIVAHPAVGLAGVLAKAKAYLDSNSYDVLHSAELAFSVAEDAERVLRRHRA